MNGRCDKCDKWAVVSHETHSYIMDEGFHSSSEDDDDGEILEILRQLCDQHHEEWLFGKE